MSQIIDVFPKVNRLHLGDTIKFVIKGDCVEHGAGVTNDCLEYDNDTETLTAKQLGIGKVVFRGADADGNEKFIDLEIKVFERPSNKIEAYQTDMTNIRYEYAKNSEMAMFALAQYNQAKSDERDKKILSALTKYKKKEMAELGFEYSSLSQKLYELGFDRVTAIGYAAAKKLSELYHSLMLAEKYDLSDDKYWLSYYGDKLYQAKQGVEAFDDILHTMRYSSLLDKVKRVKHEDNGENGFKYADAFKHFGPALADYKKLLQHFEFKEIHKLKTEDTKELLYNMEKLVSYYDFYLESQKIADDHEETYYRRIT